MAGKRASGPGGEAEWKHFVAVGGLLAAIGGTLVLGWMLQVEPGDSVTPSETAAPSQPGQIAPIAEPPPDDENSLTRRGETDLQRLQSQRGRMTLQVMMACDPDNVRPLLRELGGAPELYLVPTRYRDRPCYRVCWGIYNTRQQARDGARLPGALGAVTTSPQPTPVDRLLE